MTIAIHPTVVRKQCLGAFKESYDARPVLRGDLAMTVPSTTAEEEYAWLGGVRGVEEWLGDRKAAQLPDRSFKIANKHWEDNLRINRDHLEDDQTGQYVQMAAEMGINAADHPDGLLCTLLDKGATAGYTAYDNVVFFSAAHKEGENTNDNTDEVEVAAANTTEPTAAECHEMLEKACLKLRAMTNWAGKPFVNRITKLAVVVPPSLEIRMAKALNSELIPAQATDGTNVTGGVVTNIWKSKNIVLLSDSRVVESSTSTTDRYIYVAEVSRAIRPFVYQIRQELREQADASEEFDRNEIKWGVDARYNVGYGAYWLIVRVTVST